MGKALFEKASETFTGKFSRWSDIPHDTGTHIEIEVDTEPDVRLDRWDGATGIRVATAQELADHDDALLESRAASNLDAAINKAIRDLLLDIEQRLRAAGETSTLPDIAAANNKAEYTAALKDIVKIYL